MVGTAHSATTILATLLVLAVGCDDARPHDGSPVDGDADGDADSVDGDTASRDADREADADGELPAQSGPVAFVLQQTTFITERLCDMDGDGDLDNSIADLGSPSDEISAMVLNTVAAGRIDDVDRRFVYIPRVGDLARPHDDGPVDVVFGTGLDVDDPPDGTDDFSGDEPFVVKGDTLDACGEPLYTFDEAWLQRGELTARGGDLSIDGLENLTIAAPEVRGTIAPYGAEGTVEVCGYSTIRDLGGASAEDLVAGLTFLEVLLAGGTPLGIPGLQGLTPDLDLDGDGLERIVLDEDFHVASCIDGDRTVIDGRDCWANEGMRDALSLVLRLSGVSARLVGLEEGWQERVEGSCEAPPTESLWHWL